MLRFSGGLRAVELIMGIWSAPSSDVSQTSHLNEGSVVQYAARHSSNRIHLTLLLIFSCRVWQSQKPWIFRFPGIVK